MSKVYNRKHRYRLKSKSLRLGSKSKFNKSTKIVKKPKNKYNTKSKFKPENKSKLVIPKPSSSQPISLLTYPGSKSKFVENFAKYLIHGPNSKNNIVISPFVGGGSYEVYLARKGYEVHAGDYNKMIVNFHECVKSQKFMLMNEIFNLSPVNKTKFTKYRNYLLKYTKNPDLYNIPNIKISARYFIVNKTSFNGLGRNSSQYKIDHYNSGLKNIMLRLYHFQMPKNIYFYHQDFSKSIKLAKNHGKRSKVHLFLDPPYDVEMTHYGLTHAKEQFDHDELSNLINKLNNRNYNWVMTYNDTPYIRKLYKHSKIVNITPMVGYNNLKNRQKTIKKKKYGQILIHN